MSPRADEPLEFDSESARLEHELGIIFSRYGETDPAGDLAVVGRYFSFLSNAIESDGRGIDAPLSFLENFESVCLLLADRLRAYPDSIRHQVERLLAEERLERTFAILAALTDRDLQHVGSRPVTAVLEFLFVKLGKITADDPQQITTKTLFEAKIALHRLSQILRYAATIQPADYDDAIDDFAEHYDPRLIDKRKLLLLIAQFRVKLDSIPAESARDRLLKHLDKLDEEVRRHSPRWGRIIAGFFIIFSFVADLKSLTPSVYDAVYATAQEIVTVLHQEGGSEQRKRTAEIPRRAPAALLPPPLRVKREDEA